MINPPMYLGDAVYIAVDLENNRFVLTTDSRKEEEAGNTIYLEPEVAKALVHYLTQPMKK